MNIEKYHVHDSSSTPYERKQRIFEDVEVKDGKCDDSRDRPSAEAAIFEPEPPAEAAVVDEDDTWGFGTLGKSSSGKAKKKGFKRSA